VLFAAASSCPCQLAALVYAHIFVAVELTQVAVSDFSRISFPIICMRLLINFRFVFIGLFSIIKKLVLFLIN
jgi:hypothetical protein